jgi:transposase
MIGLDTAKTVFQVHGIDKSGRAVLRRKLHRSELVRFFETLNREIDRGEISFIFRFLRCIDLSLR